MKAPEAKFIFYRLAETAYVVVEGFRPGVVERLGIGYQKVSEISPRIVYCYISGYGQNGPYADMKGHNTNYTSLAGALGLIGHSEDEKPAISLNLLADHAGGGLCGAMTEGVLYMLAGVISDLLAQGTVPGRGAIRLNGGPPYNNVYGDSKYFSIAAIEPWFWRNLCTALGHVDSPDSRAAEGGQKQEITEFLEQTFRTKTCDKWSDLLKDKDISVGKIYSLEEVLGVPKLAHQGM